MEFPPFERQLEDRLTALETGDADAVLVSDLPLRDLLLAVGVLIAVTVALLWWAY